MRSRDVWLERHFSKPGIDYGPIVKDAVKRPELIDTLISATDSGAAPMRFGSSKALALVAAEAPNLIYPHFEFFVALLDSPNSILRWNAARVLASLAPVDRENKLDPMLEKYLSPIDGRQMIGAANAIRWSAEIAVAKPALADRIARAILRVGGAAYATDECRNVAIGHAIRAFDCFYHHIVDQPAVLAFVQAQTNNSRASTRAKALEFCGKHASGAQRIAPDGGRARGLRGSVGNRTQRRSASFR
jgi:hypothetical protein